MLIGSEANRGDNTKDTHDQYKNKITVIRAGFITRLVHALNSNG
jgi:hypothetical protein